MFFNPQGFGFVAELASFWRLIRQECQELDAPASDLPRVTGALNRSAEDLLRARAWTRPWQAGTTRPGSNQLAYLLMYRGLLSDGLGMTMPATARLLSRLRGTAVCALSLLQPGGFIRPHHDPDASGRLLTLHLGLSMEPRRCYLTVAGDAREEQPGKVLIFNPGREHHTINMGTASGVILCVEFDPRVVHFDVQS